jgi:outer membrane protein
MLHRFRGAVFAAAWLSLLLLPSQHLSAQSSANPPSSNAPASAGPPQQATGASQQNGKPLTLADAEAIALKNNPQITIGRLRWLVAQQNAREVRSALLPTAFLSLTAVDSYPNSRISAGGLNNSIVFTRAAGGATVSQLVTDFGRTTNLLSSSEYGAKAEEQNSVATRSDIILTVDQAFYNSLETQALVAVAEETVRARQALADKIQALTNTKLKSDVDLSFANVDLARAKLLLLESQNNYQTALAGLSAILGYNDEQHFQLIEENVTAAPPPDTVAPLIETAMKQRPEIQSLQFRVESAQKFASAEHDLVRPSINALGVVGGAPVRPDTLTSWYGVVGVNVNIPVFNGFLFNARAKSADLQSDVTRQQLADTRNNIARDVRNAWEDEQRGFARLSVTQQLKQQADLALDLSQARYNLGLSSIVELTQAELQKTQADIEDTDAKYQYRVTQIVLAYSIAGPK